MCSPVGSNYAAHCAATEWQKAPAKKEAAVAEELASFMPHPSSCQTTCIRSHGGDPERFAYESVAIVNELVARLRSAAVDDPHLLETTLRYAGQRRRDLAVQMRAQDAAKFGLWVCDVDRAEGKACSRLHTYLRGQYQLYALKALLLYGYCIENERFGDDRPLHIDDNFATKLILIPSDNLANIVRADKKHLTFAHEGQDIHFWGLAAVINDFIQTHQISDLHKPTAFLYNMIKIEGQWVPLSGIYKCTLPDNTLAFVAIHGCSSETEVILKHLRPRFAKLCSWHPNQGKEVLIQGIAELHYLLIHLMPFVRGSAAISEYLTKALLKMHGCKLTAYQPELRPDLESLLCALPSYKNAYASFFIEQP